MSLVPGLGEDIELITNLTSHEIHILDDEDEVLLTIPPKKNVRVILEPDEVVATILGIPFKVKRKYDTEGVELPPKEKGTVFIVSQHTWNAFPDRDDLCYPDGKVKRDGNVIGCRYLRLNR